MVFGTLVIKENTLTVRDELNLLVQLSNSRPTTYRVIDATLHVNIAFLIGHRVCHKDDVGTT